MRCTHPTSDFTDRQASRSATANTFSVGFGKRTWQTASVDPAVTLGESGYPHH